MNFLAHCLIGASSSGTELDPALVAGGFLGDFIKGPVPAEMPPNLARGVRLHRRVDAYSNQHQDIRQSCERFPPELRRIAPILVDIICDHLLARRWQEFHTDPIETFTAAAYRQVAEHQPWLSESAGKFLRYASEHDLFARYDDWSATASAMRSITRRLGKQELDAQMDRMTPALLPDLESDFLRYFPDILEHSAQWVAADRMAASADHQS